MAKRIASSSVNWTFLNKHVEAAAKPSITKLKNKSDKYLRKVTDLPAELPKIDWDFYKTKITKSGMLETFQKQYENLKIPYPGDEGMIQNIDKRETTLKEQYAKGEKEIKERIAKLEAELKVLSSRKPLSEMTNEEVEYYYPNWRKFSTELYPVLYKEPDHKSNEKKENH